MPRIYKLSRTGLKILYKIRHHRGHGIHSPFVYNLIRKVIEEKMPYYAYEDLKEHLKGNPEINHSISKYNKLSFRLVNYFNAKKILEIGSGSGINTLYLTAPAKDISCMCIETDKNKISEAKEIHRGWGREIQITDKNILVDIKEKQDCIFIDLNDLQSIEKSFISQLSPLCHQGTFIVVKGIRTNKRSCTLWKSISKMDERTAMLDLFNIGIVFFNKNLYRWNYQISF